MTATTTNDPFGDDSTTDTDVTTGLYGFGPHHRPVPHATLVYRPPSQSRSTT